MKKANRLLVLGLLAALIFWMGLAMGEGNCRQKIVESLKAGNMHDANKIWYQLQESGEDITKNPLFLVCKCIAHLNNKCEDGVRLNLNRLVDIYGK